ncbi:MAG: DUF3060 domain-containing protein [Mycolicibacterium sp.]|uniref:DUF3060 domain-containing protein n=1 Tax=Mycolicibacterium sp. TaxID=2320850 RepID=UPI003D09F454
MEPDGDPEARIRDLERPLADRARASELGTQPYGSGPLDTPPPPYSWGASQYGQPQHGPSPYDQPQYPPSPYDQPGYAQSQYGQPQHNSPYYAPPQHVVHKRSPALKLIPLVIGLVVAGIVGTILIAGFAGRDAPLTFKSEPSGGGTVEPPQVVIDPPQIDVEQPEIDTPLDPAAQVLTVGAGDTLSFGGIEQNKTVLCHHGTVNISGMTNTVEIRGDCAAVSVSGMNNVITVEHAGSITASGFDNQVTYRTGSPEISTSGNGNTIEQG